MARNKNKNNNNNNNHKNSSSNSSNNYICGRCGAEFGDYMEFDHHEKTQHIP